jgi:DNA-binding PadR family transcriptional regulator
MFSGRHGSLGCRAERDRLLVLGQRKCVHDLKPCHLHLLHSGRSVDCGDSTLDYRTSIYHTSSMSRRSDLKPMPAASMYLLLALLDGENHGYALMRLVVEQSQSSVKMGPGTLYGTLNRLLADALIIETTDDTDRSGNERRRYYQLTQDGEHVARAELDRLRVLVHRFRKVPGFKAAPA